MKLNPWAKQQGLSYKTAWRLWKAGKLPVPAEKLATGTVILQMARGGEKRAKRAMEAIQCESC